MWLSADDERRWLEGELQEAAEYRELLDRRQANRQVAQDAALIRHQLHMEEWSKRFSTWLEIYAAWR